MDRQGYDFHNFHKSGGAQRSAEPTTYYPYLLSYFKCYEITEWVQGDEYELAEWVSTS